MAVNTNGHVTKARREKSQRIEFGQEPLDEAEGMLEESQTLRRSTRTERTGRAEKHVWTGAKPMDHEPNRQSLTIIIIIPISGHMVFRHTTMCALCSKKGIGFIVSTCRTYRETRLMIDAELCRHIMNQTVQVRTRGA